MIRFDPAKDALNRAKHGLSLSMAEVFVWDSALIVVDDRKDYGEPRYRAFGRLETGLAVSMVFTPRGGDVRVISLRPAHKKERALWLAK
jgi:uncharacterized protein